MTRELARPGHQDSSNRNLTHPPRFEFRYRLIVNNVSNVNRLAADFAVFDIGLASYRHIQHH